MLRGRARRPCAEDHRYPPIVESDEDPGDGVPGDEGHIPPPLPPDDRLWRHPSELRDHPMPASSRPRPTADRPAARSLQLAAVGGLVGALLTMGILAAAGPLRTHTKVVQTIEREVPIPVPFETSAALGSIVERMQRNIARVRVQTDNGEVAASGVVFRSDGFVVTNAHLVDGARAAEVVFGDGKPLPATIIGTDPETDIAVLHVEKGTLPVAPFAADPPPRVGDTTMAVGTSVSLGIISMIGAEVTPDKGQTLLDLIQTDAPMQATSSGGALIDTKGNIIGIVDVIPGGTGYAVPVETARDVASQLIASGHVTRAWLGIEGTDVDSAMAKDLGVSGGALVRIVRPQSPADDAGIVPSDVITSLDGSPVMTMNGLKVLLRNRAPGTVIGVTFIHDGKERRTQATLKPRPNGSS